MDSLPTEIIFQIVDCLALHGQSLAPYASLSRVWQRVVEWTTFESLSLYSLDLDFFETVYKTGHDRRQSLRHLRFFPVGLIDIHSNSPELVEDVQRQTSESVTRLFEIIRDADGRGEAEAEALGSKEGLSLLIEPPIVFRRTDVKSMDVRPGQLPFSIGKRSFNRQTLPGLSTVPLDLDIFRRASPVNRVTELKFIAPNSVEYDPAAIFEMAKACPNLQNFDWAYGDCYKDGGAREAKHSALISSLRSIYIPRAEKVRFWMTRAGLLSFFANEVQFLSLPNLDIMCTAWRTFSTFENLKSLSMEGDFASGSFGSYSCPNL